MSWKKIDDLNKALNPGDKIRLTYNTHDALWLKATEAAIVESRLERKEGFSIQEIDYQTPGKIIFVVRVTKTNPVIVTVAYISGAILGAIAIFVAAGWMFEKAEIFFDQPEVKAMSAGVLIIAAIVLYNLLGGKVRAVRS